MTTPSQPAEAAALPSSRRPCDRHRAVTRSLLGYGVLAVLIAWAWLAAVSVQLYRATAKPGA